VLGLTARGSDDLPESDCPLSPQLRLHGVVHTLPQWLSGWLGRIRPTTVTILPLASAAESRARMGELPTGNMSALPPNGFALF
jgi:hypothetical protein